MRSPAQHPAAYEDLYDGDRFVDDEFLAGERIGPPLVRSGRRAMLRGVVVVLIAFGGAWAVLGDPTTWPVRAWTEALTTQVSALAASFERKTPASVERVTSAVVPSATNADLAGRIALDKPLPVETLPSSGKNTPSFREPDAPAAGPLTTASLPPRDKQQPEPLPPPTVDRADPFQVRAEAVGLHPGLSRVLLSRLSDADYRNAGIAIKTAVAETPDGAVFVWPRQRKAELALFKVHFVPGADADCRRYVVTVAKDGWVTTALPMERCGSQAGRQRRGRQAG